MERKRLEENQKGRTVEQVVDGLQDLYGAHLSLLGEVQTLVTEMARLYGMDALFVLEEWKKHYADNDIDTFREIAGMVANICEWKDASFARQFCSLGIGSWQRLDFFQFQLIITILLMKGDGDAFAVLKLFIQQKFDRSRSESVVRFLFQFGLAATQSIFELFHARSNEDYLDFVWRIMNKGELNIGRTFLYVCVDNNLTTEQATHLFARLIKHLGEGQYDLEACKLLLSESGNFTTLH